MADHLFEPLLQWVNETLAPAVAIALFAHDGITWQSSSRHRRIQRRQRGPLPCSESIHRGLTRESSSLMPDSG